MFSECVEERKSTHKAVLQLQICVEKKCLQARKGTSICINADLNNDVRVLRLWKSDGVADEGCFVPEYCS